MLWVSSQVAIPDTEIELRAIRAQGAGGQNVNKTSSAIHLRFDIGASSLPDRIKHVLLQRGDSRINRDGVVVIKAQRFRTQDKNRVDALARLKDLVRSASVSRKKRMPTKPSLGSKERRLQAKTVQSRIKKARGRVHED